MESDINACNVVDRHQLTAKRSPLNNRAVRSTPGLPMGIETTLEGSPSMLMGHSSRVLFAMSQLPQVLRTLRLLSDDAFSVFNRTAQEISGQPKQQNRAAIGIVLFICMMFVSCSFDDDSATTKIATHTYKVAVIMESGEHARWQRTAEWAMQNIAEAQHGMSERVALQLTFKSQDDSDIAEYMQQVAEDTTVVAIIGPTTSNMAEQMAMALSKTGGKPMITPSATQVEYQRKYSNVPYVWNMAESDIAQLEVLLSGIASMYGSDRTPVMLLCADDGGSEARNAYAEWFGFIAEEYGLKVDGVFLYKDEADLRRYVRQMCGTDWRLEEKVLLFNPSSPQMALAFDDEAGRIKADVPSGKYFYTPQVYCSDAFVSEQIASTVKNATYEGVDLYASPESGFNKAYRQRFGEELINGEAQFYDALCLVAYAATLWQSNKAAANSKLSTLNPQLNDAILAVVDGRDGTGGSWLPADMNRNFTLLAQGRTPDIDGVSSSWTFDAKTHASVCGSTFRRWRLYEGQFLTTEYVSTEDSRRSTSAKAVWDWTATKMQTFSADDGSAVTFPALDDRWALLVAASKGWANYRFQSDVFAMYQLLRQHGYDDDHIVLICEDDVARHANNPHQGELRISETGANVYDRAAIDYRLSDLTPADIGAILQGKRSDRLPKVLSPDADDNVFIFWSSHGSPGSLDFGGSQSMTYDHMHSILASLSAYAATSLQPSLPSARHYRKLLFAIEACYSGGLGEACEGLPGCLFITAANPYETSHADVWSEQVGVYLSNGFTRGFQGAIGTNPAISLRDLYYTLAAHTSGSHVKVYNAPHYGSVYSNTMAEYLN